MSDRGDGRGPGSGDPSDQITTTELDPDQMRALKDKAARIAAKLGIDAPEQGTMRMSNTAVVRAKEQGPAIPFSEGGGNPNAPPPPPAPPPAAVPADDEHPLAGGTLNVDVSDMVPASTPFSETDRQSAPPAPPAPPAGATQPSPTGSPWAGGQDNAQRPSAPAPLPPMPQQVNPGRPLDFFDAMPATPAAAPAAAQHPERLSAAEAAAPPTALEIVEENIQYSTAKARMQSRTLGALMVTDNHDLDTYLKRNVADGSALKRHDLVAMRDILLALSGALREGDADTQRRLRDAWRILHADPKQQGKGDA